ncbi:MAG: sugar ABC transporter substrate-binding protein, partial [Paraburkholderia sp.]
MRNFLSFSFLVSALAAAVPAAKATTIGVVLAGSSLVFYQAMIRGIERAADDQHVQLLMRNPSDGASLDTSNLQLHIID